MKSKYSITVIIFLVLTEFVFLSILYKEKGIPIFLLLAIPIMAIKDTIAYFNDTDSQYSLAFGLIFKDDSPHRKKISYIVNMLVWTAFYPGLIVLATSWF